MNTPSNNKSPVRGMSNFSPSPQRMHFGSPQGDKKLEYPSSRGLGSPCRAPSPYAAAAFGPTGAKSPSSDAVNKQNVVNIDRLGRQIENGNAPHNPQRTPSPLLGIDNLPRSKNWVGTYITVVKQIGKGSFGEAFLATVNHDGGNNLTSSSTGGGGLRSTSPLSNLPPPPRSVSPPSSGAFSHAKHNSGSPTPRSPVSHFPPTIVIKVTPDQRNFRYALKEIELLRKIRHPHICQYVDSWRELGGRSEFEGKMCFAMEYCDSGDLEKFIDTYKNRYCRQIPPEVVSVLSLQLLSAVASCHANKIVHRDIKPQNIFLTRRELTAVADIGNTPPVTEAQTRRTRTVIALGDFGISKDLSYTMEASSSVVGTPYYMCPEIVSKQPYTNTSDVWSVGVVLYEMMMLERPFELSRNVDRRYQMGLLYDDICRSDPVDLLRRKCAGIYDSWLINVTAACLRKNPEERPSAMELLTNFSPAVDQLLVRHKIPVPRAASGRSAAQKQQEKEKQQLGRDSSPLTPTSNGSPKRLQQSAAISPLSEKASPPSNKFESEERGQHKQQGYGSHQQLSSATPVRNASPRQDDYALQPTASPSPLDGKNARARQAVAPSTSMSDSSSSPNKRDPIPTGAHKEVRALSAARDFSSGDVLRPAKAPTLLSPSRGLTPMRAAPPSPTRDSSVLPQRDSTSPLPPQQRTESSVQRRSPSVPSTPSPQRGGGLAQPIPLGSAAGSPSSFANRPPINIDVVRSSPIRKAPPSPQTKALLRFQQEQHQPQEQQQLTGDKTTSTHQSPNSRRDGVDTPLSSQSQFPSRAVSASMGVLDDLKRRRAAREEELTRMRQEQDNRLVAVVAEARAGREREKEKALQAMREEAAAQARAMQEPIISNNNINKKEKEVPTKAAIGGTADDKTRGATPKDEEVKKSPTTRSSQKDRLDDQPRARSPLSSPPSINSVATLRAEHPIKVPRKFPLGGSDSDLLAAGKALGGKNVSNGSSRCSSPPSSPPRPPPSPLRAAPSSLPRADPSKPTPLVQLQKTPPPTSFEGGSSSVRTSPTAPTPRNSNDDDTDAPLLTANVKGISLPFVVNADRYTYAAPTCGQNNTMHDQRIGRRESEERRIHVGNLDVERNDMRSSPTTKENNNNGTSALRCHENNCDGKGLVLLANPPISSPQLATTTCPPSPCETSALSPTRPSSPPLPLSSPPTPTKHRKKDCIGPFALHDEAASPNNMLGKDGSDAGTAIAKITFSESASIQNTAERKGAMAKPPKSKTNGVKGTCAPVAAAATAAVPRPSSSNSAILIPNADALCIDSVGVVDFHATNAALDVAKVMDRHARALSVGSPLLTGIIPTASDTRSLFQLSNATSFSSSALSPNSTTNASSTGTLPPFSTTLSAASQAERSSTTPSSSLSHLMTSSSTSSSPSHHKYTSPHASANEALLIEGLSGDVEAFLIVKLLSLTTPKTLLGGGEGREGDVTREPRAHLSHPAGVVKGDNIDLDGNDDGDKVADGDCLSSFSSTATSCSFSSSLSLSFDVNSNSSNMGSDDAEEETHAAETKAIAENDSVGKCICMTALLPTTLPLTLSQYEAFVKFRATAVIEALRRADERFLHKIVPAASMVARHSKKSTRSTRKKGQVVGQKKQTEYNVNDNNDINAKRFGSVNNNNDMNTTGVGKRRSGEGREGVQRWGKERANAKHYSHSSPKRMGTASSSSARHTDPTVDDTSFSSCPKGRAGNCCDTKEKAVNAPFGCTQNHGQLEEIPYGADKHTTVVTATSKNNISEQNTSPHRLQQAPSILPSITPCSTSADALSNGKKPFFEAIDAFLSDTRLSGGRRGDLTSTSTRILSRRNTRKLAEEEASSLPHMPSGGSLG